MKNLKRVLSLALTGVMLVGMMAIGASAANKDFTDADEIQHTEAVNVMSTLGVLKGKDTGAFDPAATVTRAEMAKIICVMLNGGNDPTLGTSGANMFSDTASHWAKSYIEYCASMGIIAGMGDGTFGPDLPVTGAAAAKMLLVALGYDSDISGFTGVDWEINVNRQANEAKLYEEIKSIDTSAGLSRDNTAQMAYNALEAKLMVREDNKVVSSGEISYTYKKGSQSFLNKYFDASVFIGTFEGNNATGASGTAKGEILIRGNLDTENTEVGTTGYVAPKAARIPSDLAISFIGEEFKVIFKDTRGGIMGQPDKNDTIYGIFNTGAVTVYNVTKADLQDAGSTNVGRGKIKFNDTVYDVAAADKDYEVIVKNYGNMAAVDGADIHGSDDDATKAEIATYINTETNGLRVKSSDPIKFVTNASGEIVRAYVENWTYSSVLSMTSSKIQLEGVGSKDLEDVAMLDDEIKVDDIVAVADFYPAGTTKTQVKKASTLRGVIEAIDGAKLRIDGTWYNKSVNAEGLSDYSDTQTYDVGDEYELVLDGEKFYVAGKTISAEVNYALALKSETGLTERVRMLLADGTEQTYIINSDSTVKHAGIGSSLAAADAKLVKYELVKGGTEVKMTLADTNTGNHTWNKDTKVVNINGAKTTSDSAVAFVYNSTTDKWRVIQASNMGSITVTANSAAYYAMKSGKVVAFTLKSTAFPTGVADSSSYGYVTGKIVTKNGDDTVTELTIWDGTEDVKVQVDGRTASAVAGDFVKFPVSNAPVADSEVVKTAGGLNWEVVKIKEYDSNRNLVITTAGTYSVTGTLVGDTESVYKMDSNSKIIGVNTADKKSSSNNTITPYTKISGSDYKNAYIISEDDTNGGTTTKVIKAIFVDVDNALRVVGDGDTRTGAAGSSYTVAAATTSTGSSAPVAALNNAYIGVATDKTSAIQGEKVTYTVTVYGNVGSTPGQVVAPSGVTLDSVEGDGVTKDTNTAKIAANKGNGAVLKFSKTVATSNVAAVDFALTTQGGSPAPTTYTAAVKASNPVTVTGSSDTTYAAANWTVELSKTSGLADDEEVTVTIKYTGTKTDTDDSFDFTISATSGADGFTQPSASLTGIQQDKSWTGKLTVNAANVVDVAVAVTITETT